jgi:alpha-D-xyloside xylohydrolase
MLKAGYYIPGTDWIDFFNPEAADAYWKNFSSRLLPLGIDAWWQDATEPENDDLL